MSPTPRPDDAHPALPPRVPRALTVAWTSFLAASLGTMVFFAFVDPTPVVAVLRPTDTLPSRTALYSLGFFFFWAVCALASTFTATLLTPHDDVDRRR